VMERYGFSLQPMSQLEESISMISAMSSISMSQWKQRHMCIASDARPVRERVARASRYAMGTNTSICKRSRRPSECRSPSIAIIHSTAWMLRMRNCEHSATSKGKISPLAVENEVGLATQVPENPLVKIHRDKPAHRVTEDRLPNDGVRSVARSERLSLAHHPNLRNRALPDPSANALALNPNGDKTF
jgi:hypothetical protein